MDQKEKRKVENRLLAMGWDGTNGDLCEIFVGIIQDFPGDKHWFFRGLINECEPSKRTEMYEALRPRFTKFSPLPLEVYLSEIAEQAGAMVSHGKMRVEGSAPTAPEVGALIAKKYRGPRKKKGQDSSAIFRCTKCRKTQKFFGLTVVDAIIAGRKAGWKKDLTQLDDEYCPKCELPEYMMEIESQGNA